MASEREVVGAIVMSTEDEAVSSEGRTKGPGVLDNEGGGAKGGGRFGVLLVLQLGVDGRDREDGHVDGGVEDREASELGSDPQLFDGKLGAIVIHPRASDFFFAAERAFVGIAGWKTSK